MSNTFLEGNFLSRRNKTDSYIYNQWISMFVKDITIAYKI